MLYCILLFFVIGLNNTAFAAPLPPTLTKVFAASTISLNGITSLTFHIANPNSSDTLNNVNVIDNLPAGLVIATPNGFSGSCTGGSNVAVIGGSGTGTIQILSGLLVPSSSCTFSFNIKGTSGGIKNNVTTAPSSTESGPGSPASASLTVIGPPSLTKAFSPSTIPLNSSSVLTFTVTNPNSSSLSGLAFSDTLPAGLVVATPNGLSSTCGGTSTATAGSSLISLSSGSLAANTSCTVLVNVTGITAGTKNNTSSLISSTEGGTGNTASASLTVSAESPVITSANSTTFTFGVANSFTVTATGIPTPTLTASGTLPTGVIFNPSTGVLSGTPTQSGTFSITFTASNGVLPDAVQAFTLNVTPFIPPDPTTDRGITGLINAQKITAQLFAQTNISQLTDHLQQLHRFDLKKNTISFNFKAPLIEQYQESFLADQYRNSNFDQKVQPSLNTATPNTYSLPNLNSFAVQELALNDLLFNNFAMSLWGSSTLSYGKIITNPSDVSDHFTLDGFFAGLDFQARATLITGLAIGYTTDKNNLEHLNAVSNADQLSFSGYTTYTPYQNWFIDALIGYGSPSFSNTRKSLLGNFSSTRDGRMTYGSLGLTNQFAIKTILTQLFCHADFVSAELNQYTEQGGAMALTYGSLDASNTAWSGGISLSKILLKRPWVLTSSAKTQYSYNSGSNSNQGLFYTNLGPSNFNYNFNVGNVPKNMESLALSLNLAKENKGSMALEWVGSMGSSSFLMNAVDLKLSYPIS